MFNSSVKKALNIAQVQKVKGSIVKNDLEKFNNSIVLAGLMRDAHKWLTSLQGKQFLKSENYGQYDFIAKAEVFGMSKTWFNELKNAGYIIEERPEIVAEYLKSAEEFEAAGVNVSRSIQTFQKFYNESKLEDSSELSEAGASEDSEAGASEPKKDAKDVLKKKTDVLTLAFAGASIGLSNVSVRIGSDGQFKTSNDAQQIGEAVSYLLKALKGSGLMESAPAVVETGTGTAKKKAANKKAQKVKELHEFFTTDSAE
jgi:preprotein translocase subunit SecG